jgi:hypothetical protein
MDMTGDALKPDLAMPKAALDGRPSRLTGASVAIGIAGIAGLVGTGLGAPFLLLGIPAAMAAGWVLAPRVGPSTDLAGLGAAMGGLTVVLADTMLMVGAAAASLDSNGDMPRDLVAGVIGMTFFWMVGLLVVGLPVLILTIPCGVLWVFLVRRLSR